LKGEPVALVCQNINYFIGGAANIWRNSTDQFGLETYDPYLNKEDKEAVKRKTLNDKEHFREVFKNTEQKLNDQKLEFFTYTSTWKAGCFKVRAGEAEKVYHGTCPIILKFKETPPKVTHKFINFY
jgi:hypothetical protein